MIETPLHKVKVMMVFPRPYFRIGHANGLALAYSSFEGKHHESSGKAPPTFTEVMTELMEDVPSVKSIKRADLKQWTRRGVLLWNAVPTTYMGMEKAHDAWGWDVLTKEIIETVYLVNPDCVFVFFGDLKKHSNLLPNEACVLEVPYPTGLTKSAFRGSRLFTAINKMRKDRRHHPIDWRT